MPQSKKQGPAAMKQSPNPVATAVRNGHAARKNMELLAHAITVEAAAKGFDAANMGDLLNQMRAATKTYTKARADYHAAYAAAAVQRNERQVA